MAKTIFYTIRRKGKYLHGVLLNDKAPKNPVAPTMGTRYTPCDYLTVWGDEPKPFEPITAANYIKIIMEEYRWEQKKPETIEIIPDLP